MKKQNKKNRKKNNNYNGRNVFGDRCLAKTIKFESGVAYQQAQQMIDDIFASEIRIEYTIDWSGLTTEETYALQEKMELYWQLRQMCA